MAITPRPLPWPLRVARDAGERQHRGDLQPSAGRASFDTFAAAPELDACAMKAADALGFVPAR